MTSSDQNIYQYIVVIYHKALIKDGALTNGHVQNKYFKQNDCI